MEEETVFNVKISKRGVFDMDKLYSAVMKWYKAHDFKAAETKHKDKPDAYGGRVLYHEWAGDVKATPYVRYFTDVIFDVREATPVEVKKEDKKLKKTRARISITIHSRTVADWRKVFEKGPFMKRFEKLVNKYLRKRDITSLQGQLIAWSSELHSTLKKQLEMETAG
ncbi:hypothetical protein KY325_02645 [Candidatus Woesearchaeota archaeon]|nr:hypothetical protein [Candidatus Woesearchaeota archaeon]MBW3018032.1 hypothetical protein [Candidatus Woesearchaeota archaeon]